MLNFSFGLASKLSKFEKTYLSVHNYINATLVFPKLLRGGFAGKLFSALDSFWLKHVYADWYSTSEVKITIRVVAEALSDHKLSDKELNAIVSYVILLWDPEVAKNKKIDNDILDSVEPAIAKAINVYRNPA